jgi:hypothetical protein
MQAQVRAAPTTAGYSPRAKKACRHGSTPEDAPCLVARELNGFYAEEDRMAKKKLKPPPYWARQHADGDWMRAPLAPGSAEWGIVLCRDRRMAQRLVANGPVLPVRGPIDGEEHAVVIEGDLCIPMPMGEAFGDPSGGGKMWRQSDWLTPPAGGGRYRPSPEVVLGVGVLMLLATGRSPAEVVALHMGMPKFARYGQKWWSEMVPQVRGWAEEHAGRAAQLPGLLDYLAHLDPDSSDHHSRYAAALVAMAARQGAGDDEAAGWILRDAADLAGQMVAG